MGLLELAERCEQATGADRRLDAEIDIAVRGFPEQAYEQTNGLRGKGSPELNRIDWFIKWGADRYTASLDAAMTLVPEGYVFGLGNFDPDGGTAKAAAIVGATPDEDRNPTFAATPALALCAAALRARESAT